MELLLFFGGFWQRLWGAPVPKRAQRASEASARSDSARAVVKSRRPGESYAALLGGVFCGLLNF